MNIRNNNILDKNYIKLLKKKKTKYICQLKNSLIIY